MTRPLSRKPIAVSQFQVRQTQHAIGNKRVIIAHLGHGMLSFLLFAGALQIAILKELNVDE